MAISTGDAVNSFGTQTTVSDTTANVSNEAFSVVGDAATFTNTDDAPQASFVAMFNFSVAPDTNSSVNLYCRPMNIDGTSDQEVPSASFRHGFLDSFPVDDVTTAQYISIDVVLPNTYTGQVYEFYIENITGQTMPAGWTLKLTPKTLGPKA